MEFINPIENETAIIEKLTEFFNSSVCHVERYPDNPDDYSLLAPGAVLTHFRGDTVSESITNLGDTIQNLKNTFDITVIAKKLHPTTAERGDAVLSIIEDIVNGRKDQEGIVREKGLRKFKLPDGSYLVYKGTKFLNQIEDEWWYECTFEAETGLE